MANVNSAFGLRPVRTLTGAPWNAQLMKVYFATGESNNIFLGDPVIFTGTSDATGQCPSVGIASAGATYPILGVVVAFDVDPTNLELKYRVASTARYAYITVDPAIVYEVQCSGTFAITDVGANAVLNAGGGGSTVTGFSSWYLYNTTTPAADATYQLTILGAAKKPNNAVGLYTVVEVKINISEIFSTYDAHATAWYGSLGVA